MKEQRYISKRTLFNNGCITDRDLNIVITNPILFEENTSYTYDDMGSIFRRYNYGSLNWKFIYDNFIEIEWNSNGNNNFNLEFKEN